MELSLLALSLDSETLESSNEESRKPNEQAGIISRSTSRSTPPPAKKRKCGCGR